MLDPAAAAFINHLLRGASWARNELRRFSGKTARFEVMPLALSLTVLEVRGSRTGRGRCRAGRHDQALARAHAAARGAR